VALSKKVGKVLEELHAGDLVRVQWCDASVGKSMSTGVNVDVPVESWGVYIGVFGKKQRAIIIAQNAFRYADGLFDLDYTAIPLQWSLRVEVISKDYVKASTAKELLRSLLTPGQRVFRRRTHQEKVRNHNE
jgi:hypothetical protein